MGITKLFVVSNAGTGLVAAVIATGVLISPIASTNAVAHEQGCAYRRHNGPPPRVYYTRHRHECMIKHCTGTKGKDGKIYTYEYRRHVRRRSATGKRSRRPVYIKVCRRHRHG